MALAGSLVVDLTLQSAQFVRDLGKATSNLNAATKQMNRMLADAQKSFGVVMGSVKALAVSLGATVLGGGIIYATKQSLAFADAIGKAAQIAGLSTDAFQEYNYAANRAGIETEEFNRFLHMFASGVGQAREGTGHLTAFVQKYDAELLNVIRHAPTTEAALDAVFGAMAKAVDAADRAALAQAAFGRHGEKMGAMVGKGAEGLAEMRKEAHELGAVLESRFIVTARQANDQLGRMAELLKVNLARVLISSGPQIIEWGNTFIRVIARASRAVGAFLPAELAPLEDLEERLRRVREQIKLFEEGKTPPFIATLLGAPSDWAAAAKYEAVLMRLIEARKREGIAFRQVIAVRDRSIELWGLEAQAMRELMGEGDKLRESLATPLEKLQADAEKFNALLEVGAIDMETYGRAVNRAKGEFYGLGQASRDMGQAVATAFEDAIVKTQDYRKVLQSLIQDIARVALRTTVTTPLVNTLGTAFSNLASSLFPTPAGVDVYSTGTPGSFGGPRARGGPVSAGRDYLVGERGMEIFRPRVGGEIIPAGRAAGGGTYYIDARGADPGQLDRVENLIRDLNGSIEHRAVAAVANARARGGSFGGIFR